MDIPLVNSDIFFSSSRKGSLSVRRENSPLRSPKNSDKVQPVQLPIVHNSNVPAPTSNSPKDNNTFKVFVRVRPLNSKEQSSNSSKKKQTITKVEDNMIFVFAPKIGKGNPYKQERSYIFDNVFDHQISTTDVYQRSLLPAVQNVISGYNSTILAYGMTGAGKTFTMFGDIYNSMGGISVHPGIVSLVVKDLFAAFEREAENGFQFKIKFSYLEIYNEHARDLLTPNSDEMMIIEDSQKGILIPNLSEFPINEHDEIVKYILQGNSRRVMASTTANQFSSRSHAIIQLTIEKWSKTKDIVSSFLQSKLSLVDLAGSERAAVSENRGMRQREGANINRSLLALGNCINVLSDSNKKGAFVPYRDSKLTRLLKDSLGGNTRTVMLACISPSYLAYEETSNTLKYASGARNIKRKILKNVKEVELHISEYKGIIESLKAEVGLLRQKLLENKAGEKKVSSKVSLELTAKLDGQLDELGKKLLTIFEESWEIMQSITDLKELKEQNEESLRIKVSELEGAVGDVALYNQVTQEITSLKEVMKNNEEILMEMEERLDKSEKEKKTVQGQIVEMINQSAQMVQAAQSEENTMHVEKSMRLLEMENDILDQNFAYMKEKQSGGNPGNENRIQDLESEVRRMKKQLEEKDRQLARNEILIKTLSHHVNEKQKAVKSSPRQPTNPSPIKGRFAAQQEVVREHAKIYHESYKLEQSNTDIPVVVVQNKRSKNKNRITSPITIKIAQPLASFKSPEKTQPGSFNNLNATSTNTSTFCIKLPETKVQQKKTKPEHPVREESIKKPTTIVNYEKLQQTPKAGHLAKKAAEKKDKGKHRQSFEIISVDDLKGYADKLKMNFESLEKKGMEEKPTYLQHYQNRKKKVEDHTLNRQSSAIYKISDQQQQNQYGSGKMNPNQSQGNINDGKETTKSENEIGTNDNSGLPNDQVHQQQHQNKLQNHAGDISPEISSIGHEQSGDFSMKEILLENFSIDTKDKVLLKKELDDKENMQDLEGKEIDQVNEELLPGQKIGGYVRSFTAAGPQKRPQVVECKNSTTYQNIRKENRSKSPSKSKSREKRSPVKPHPMERQNTGGSLLLQKAKAKQAPANFNSYARQYFNEDTENKYSKRYEILKGKKMAKEGHVLEVNKVFHTGDALKKLNDKSPIGHHEKKPFNPYTITESTNTSLAKDLGVVKHEIKSLEAMRELVKGFRARLHGYSAMVNGNALEENRYEEIANFLGDYKMNGQGYPLSNADMVVIKKLEDALAEKMEAMGHLRSAQIVNSFSLHQLPQADLGLVNPNEFSRDVYSESNTHREQQEEQSPGPYALDKANHIRINEDFFINDSSSEGFDGVRKDGNNEVVNQPEEKKNESSFLENDKSFPKNDNEFEQEGVFSSPNQLEVVQSEAEVI